MRTYLVSYRERGNKHATVHETSVTAKSAKEAKKAARVDLWGCYVIVDVRRELV